MEYGEKYIEEGDKFLDLFRELETVIRKECHNVGISTENYEGFPIDIGTLIRQLKEFNSIVRNYEYELRLFRDIRNINSHQNDDSMNLFDNDFRYAISPSPNINAIFRRILDEINNPPKIIDSNICVKEIYTRRLEDTVIDTMKTMIEKNYSYIPILDNNGNFQGVFSEKSLIDYIDKGNSVISIGENTKFFEILDVIKLENHAFEKIEFRSKNTSVYDIINMYKDYFKNHIRLGCVFITENGLKTEEICGIITAWDVLGNK